RPPLKTLPRPQIPARRESRRPAPPTPTRPTERRESEAGGHTWRRRARALQFLRRRLRFWEEPRSQAREHERSECAARTRVAAHHFSLRFRAKPPPRRRWANEPVAAGHPPNPHRGTRS